VILSERTDFSNIERLSDGQEREDSLGRAKSEVGQLKKLTERYAEDLRNAEALQAEIRRFL
jgi:hypothetical protein